jgi:hypothetical protein
MKKNIIYKNDLKFLDEIDLTKSEFQSDDVKTLYNKHKDKPKIEMRITDSELESNSYLDLSKLNLNDNLLNELLLLSRIKTILSNIIFLDLSTNNLTKIPDLSVYPNIKYLSISKNKINGIINNNNFIELTCDFNEITQINSTSMKRISACNNNIETINVPNIKILHINNNNLIEISEYNNLEYLECINNKIKNIKNLLKLEELYIGNNELENLEKLPNLLVLNCIQNPIKRINYFEKINIICCSTHFVSAKFQIASISKMKDDFLFNIK